MKKYTFPHGGLIYDDPTAPPMNDPVEDAFLPSISIIPFWKRNIKGVTPLVSIGDAVKEGMLIGRATSPDAVNVHATVPGRVIQKISWEDKEGFSNEAFVIRMEGTFEKLGRREEVFSWKGLNSYDIQKIISEFGIVEMENTGRPMAEMISSFRKANERQTLVVRCVFDDPWLAGDYALCCERINAVVEGSIIFARALSRVERIIYAVSYKEKILGFKLLSEASQWDIPASLVLTGSRYPQRNNRELELALRSYEKKEGLDLGAFFIAGPVVLAAVFDAVKHKKPVLERYIAVGGAAVRYPQIMKVRIGTRIGELIDQCGGFIAKPFRIGIGSPLLGKEVKYLDEPVESTCYAIAVMSKSQTSVSRRQNCINCGECRAVCPLGLDPQNIYKRIIEHEYIEKSQIPVCHGCGCCMVVCPSSLPLSETILELTLEEKSA